MVEVNITISPSLEVPENRFIPSYAPCLRTILTYLCLLNGFFYFFRGGGSVHGAGKLSVPWLPTNLGYGIAWASCACSRYWDRRAFFQSILFFMFFSPAIRRQLYMTITTLTGQLNHNIINQSSFVNLMVLNPFVNNLACLVYLTFIGF